MPITSYPRRLRDGRSYDNDDNNNNNNNNNNSNNIRNISNVGEDDNQDEEEEEKCNIYKYICIYDKYGNLKIKK